MPFTGPAEDRLAIRELIERYADAVTTVDAASMSACWAKDSVWALPDHPDIGEIHGRDAIIQTWIAAMSHYPGLILVATPGAIEVEGARATARSYTSEVHDKDGETRRDRGRYDDVLVKEDGAWLFQRRVFKNIHKA